LNEGSGGPAILIEGDNGHKAQKRGVRYVALIEGDSGHKAQKEGFGTFY